MPAPKLPSFLKSLRHKTFDYNPMYYDSKTDEREMRKRQMGVAIRKGSQRTFDSTGKARQQYNIRLAVIIAALVALAYFIISF